MAPAAPSHTTSLHLLRALLREATYLPDAAARLCLHRYVLQRFRAYQPAPPASSSSSSRRPRRSPAMMVARTARLHKKARKGLHYLRRANLGELPCLRKVLLFTYGRIGPAKHALLAQVLRPDPLMDGDRLAGDAAADLAAPTPLQALYRSRSRCLRFFDAPKPAPNGMLLMAIADRYSRLRAVVRSQHQRGLSLGRELKSAALKTPMHNIWMRPMPLVRARNNVRRWYAVTMSRLLPPLPAETWDKMQAMVDGRDKISIVPRRTPATSSASSSGDADAVQTILQGLHPPKLSTADRPRGMWRPHNITVHFMRRLYSRVLQLCCKLEYNEERKQWSAVWGSAIQRIRPHIYAAPTDASLFAGVDAAGRILRAPKEPGPKDQAVIQPRNEQGEYLRFPFFTEQLPTSHPLRRELDAWKAKRVTAGMINQDGTPPLGR
ncbi:hypothetical protein ACEQ8H_006993 [Pleosporales sp. CAS-2024a]